MKSLFTFFLIVIVFSVSAQDGVIVKYFDSAWKPTSKENASYYTHFVKEDTLYKCTSYYAKSNQVYGKSTYADTLFSKGKARGKMLLYYEGGSLKDSSLFSNNGILQYNYGYYENGVLSLREINPTDCDKIIIDRYYQNGELWVHEYFDTSSRKIIIQGYDETGKLNPNFIYQKEALFPDGKEGWKSYLQKNLNTCVPQSNGACVGNYKVIVDFKVDKAGNIIDVVTENDPGFGTKEEAIRVISSSPKWEPAIQYNKPVIYRAKQPITFNVTKK